VDLPCTCFIYDTSRLNICLQLVHVSPFMQLAGVSNILQCCSCKCTLLLRNSFIDGSNMEHIAVGNCTSRSCVHTSSKPRQCAKQSSGVPRTAICLLSLVSGGLGGNEVSCALTDSWRVFVGDRSPSSSWAYPAPTTSSTGAVSELRHTCHCAVSPWGYAGHRRPLPSRLPDI
jgi:hypothetical protein